MMKMLLAAALTAGVFGCNTDLDCALNGKCVSGQCACEDAWTGDRCENLKLQPADLTQGFCSPHTGGVNSSWGGSVIEFGGEYHMFSAMMDLECGILYWEPNSMVVHATSKHPAGPYTLQDVVAVPFAHEPNVVRAPTGEVVLYFTMRHPNGYKEWNCTGPNITAAAREPESNGPPARSSYMMWAPTPSGPWSDPVLVLQPNTSKWGTQTVLVDTNLAMAIRKDGSAVGLWRKCTNQATGKCAEACCTFIHSIHAADWKDPTTYVHSADPVFAPVSPFGSEDPFVYLDEEVEGGVHAILHDEHGVARSSANGTHAFSADGGKTWTYGKSFCYDKHVETVNGTTITLARRERPHLILDANNHPIYVTNGVQESTAPTDCTKDPHCTRSWTLVQRVGSQ